MHSDQAPPSADVKPLPGPWHDRYFKSIFKTPEQICALLQLVFHPLLLALFDLGTLRLRANKISKPDSLTEFVSDRLVSVRLKDGDEVGIHLLFEHKSAPDRGLMFQLGRYMLDLLEHQAALVVPVTLYHGKADWQPRWFADLQYANQPARLMELIGNSLLNFENFLISLREESVQAVAQALATAAGTGTGDHGACVGCRCTAVCPVDGAGGTVGGFGAGVVHCGHQRISVEGSAIDYNVGGETFNGTG